MRRIKDCDISDLEAPIGSSESSNLECKRSDALEKVAEAQA